MEQWLGDSLSKCLECVVTDEMMRTIMAIKNDEEFDNYFGNLLCEEVEDHRLFLKNCRRMLLSGKQPRSTGKIRLNPSSTPNPNTSGGAGKKGKNKNLYGDGGKLLGEGIILKGRRICDCQAAEHKLINNCMRCGRIVCEQEGSGPCLFCGQQVYTNEQEQQQQQQEAKAKAKAALANKKPLTKAERKKQQQQQKEPQSEKSKKDLKEAVAQRDRLLEYDRNSEKRTTVIDDELDYFKENSVWLTDEERKKYEQLKEEMHDLKHGSRVNRKIKVDFAGRQLPDEPQISKAYEQQVLRQLSAASKSASMGTGLTGHSTLGLAPYLDVAKPPVFKASTDQTAQVPPIRDGLERMYNRVQDKELLEMQDMRQCLSMHQPWASLLVAGIKKHEGRVWYSDHRGRLWIASTSKEPHADDIAQMEQFYRSLYDDEDLKFPTHYPTGSLLGCVSVDSCLPQEEYRDLYPQGESDSPYVLVCSKPKMLPVLLPVKGEHKIYELPLKTHNAACKTLLRLQATKG